MEKLRKNISAVGTTGENALKWVTLSSFKSDLLYGWGLAQTCSPSPSPNPLPPHPHPHHVQTSAATLLSYISARLRRITFKFGNFTATEIKIKLKFIKSI